MRDKLIAAGLWEAHNSNNPSLSVTAAWQVLARVGVACQYVGQTLEGDYEYLVYHRDTGAPIASGRGKTAPIAMCQAALAVMDMKSAGTN